MIRFQYGFKQFNIFRDKYRQGLVVGNLARAARFGLFVPGTRQVGINHGDPYPYLWGQLLQSNIVRLKPSNVVMQDLTP